MVAGLIAKTPTIIIGPHLAFVGILLSVPLTLDYRSDSGIDAAIFGAILGLGVSWAFQSGDMANQTGMDYLFTFSCLGAGIFLPFVILKKQIEHFVGA